MKFRCERDVLVEALGTAGRAAAGRGTSLPVLSGVKVRAHRQPAPPHRHRSRAHDLRRGRRGRRSRRRRGPPRPARIRHRPRPAGRQRLGGGDRRRGPHLGGPLGVQPPGAPGRRVPAAHRGDGRAGHPRQRRAGRGAHAGGAGRVQRRRSADPHRRAAGRRSRGPAAGGHRLLPARDPRPARHHGAERGPARARAVPCAPGARPAAQRRRRGALGALGSGRPASRWAAPASPPC